MMEHYTMVSIERKKQISLALYTLQEEIASEALQTHDLATLEAYQTVLNVIDNAFLERPDAPIAEVKRWLQKYPVRASENRVEAAIVSGARQKVAALKGGS
jgi:hypothetical protein